MNTPQRLSAYTAGVAVLALAAYGVGSAVGPVGAETATPHRAHADAGGHEPAAADNQVPGGLQVSEGGYTLEVVTPPSGPGVEELFSFRVLDPSGERLTRYTRTHDKDLHLIVVRRDLSGFQHVHPTMAAGGTWSVPLTFPSAGSYRVFADFTPGEADDGLTLGVDVEVPGQYAPVELPPPARTFEVDGYTVALAGDLVPGEASKLTLSVSKGGRPVTDLQPYLAAYGHLVALRTGDLAYLHVHPEGEPGDGATRPGPDVTFYAEVPSAGAHRLYLDFKHDGVVRTAEFTAVAAATGATAAPGAGHTHVHGEGS